MSLTNLVHLITIVLIPLLAVVGGIGVVLGPSSFKLDAKNGLLNQGLLWLAILLPISYFFVFGFIAWEGYTIEISSKGLIKFFEISKIPLTFISLALPLTIWSLDSILQSKLLRKLLLQATKIIWTPFMHTERRCFPISLSLKKLITLGH